jgi:hypothetical protein
VLLLLPQPVNASRHASARIRIAPNRAFVWGWNFVVLLEAVNIGVPLQVSFITQAGVLPVLMRSACQDASGKTEIRLVQLQKPAPRRS